MTIHSNFKLGTSFELPERMTIKQDTIYQLAVNEGIKYAESLGLQVIGSLAYGIVTGAALQSGLIENWSSVVMPRYPDSIDDVSLPVVYWAGPIIIEFVDKARNVPKVSFWRRLRLALTVGNRLQKH